MKNNDYSEERTLYIVGLIGISCILIFLLILHFLNIDLDSISVPCQVYENTGYYCPGCGGTRAIKALFNGDIIGSLKYHPLIVYIVVFFSLFMILNTISLIVKKDFSGMRVSSTLIILMPIIIFVQFAIKNLLLIIFDIRII